MNNKELLEKFVEENHQRMASFVKLRLAKDESEDVLQSVYYKMLKNDSTVNDENNREGYIKSASRRLSYNMFKSKSSCKTATDLGIENNLTSVFCNRSKDRSDINEIAGMALSCLPEPYLSTIRMYYLEGMPISEISESVGIPEGTVKRRMHEGRKRMKKFMKEKGYEYSDIFV